VKPLTVEPLSAFLRALTLTEQASETAGGLGIYRRVTGEHVRAMPFEAVARLTAAYGDAIRKACIKVEDLPELEIHPRMTQEEFERQRDRLDPRIEYTLDLQVDKHRLVAAALGEKHVSATVFWFFASSVENVLSKGLQEFEEAIWGERVDEGRLMLVGDTDLHNIGPMLVIAGGAQLADRPPRPPTPDTSVLRRIERIRAGVEHISWDHPFTARLTPVHLELADEPGLTPLEKLLASAFVQLCLLYTCNRARRPDNSGDMHAEYRGGSGAVAVPFPAARPIPAQVSGQTSTALVSLVDWCYHSYEESSRDWITDRLQFFQVQLAHHLEAVPAEQRLGTLLATVADVRMSLDDQWRNFIDGKIRTYLDDERKLEELVQKVVQAFGERATALTKSLSDVMLGAIAALIGSAIAAAFKTPFNATLFRVGMLAYAVYIVIFPGLYGIGAQLGQFNDIKQAFVTDTARFTTLLGSDSVSGMVDGPERRARRRFYWWLGLTIAGFVIAAAGAVVLAFVLPSAVT
jgi:hypothetical protein